MKKTKKPIAFTSLMKILKIQKSMNVENLDNLANACNESASIINEHLKLVKAKCESNDFSNVNGIDFNSWAHTQENVMRDVYSDMSSLYFDLHFKLHSFNAY